MCGYVWMISNNSSGICLLGSNKRTRNLVFIHMHGMMPPLDNDPVKQLKYIRIWLHAMNIYRKMLEDELNVKRCFRGSITLQYIDHTTAAAWPTCPQEARFPWKTCILSIIVSKNGVLATLKWNTTFRYFLLLERLCLPICALYCKNFTGAWSCLRVGQNHSLGSQSDSVAQLSASGKALWTPPCCEILPL